MVQGIQWGKRRPNSSANEENINKIKDLMLLLSSPGLSIRDIAAVTGMSFGSVQLILKNNLQ